MALPVLYSFRRCPYAMRARMAIASANTDVQVELREVVLKDKPACMLEYSPKGEVPVLVLDDGQVIDESLDIMHWALRQHDPLDWHATLDDQQRKESDSLIAMNDHEFKHWLDRYKYHVGYPEQSQQEYRDQAVDFLQQLEQRLIQTEYLHGDRITITDIAIFPFVRQFACVDKHWFDNSRYALLQQWLARLLHADCFTRVMQKYPAWKAGDAPTLFPA